jgi:hypothetical protein
VDDLPEIHPGIGLGDVLVLLPLVEELLTLYPRLIAAKVGDEIDTPAVSNLRIAHGKFDAVLQLTKRG